MIHRTNRAKQSAQMESERQFRLSRNAQVYYALPRRTNIEKQTNIDKPEGAGWVVTFGTAGVVVAIILLIAVVKAIVWAAQKWNW